MRVWERLKLVFVRGRTWPVLGAIYWRARQRLIQPDEAPRAPARHSTVRPVQARSSIRWSAPIRQMRLAACLSASLRHSPAGLRRTAGRLPLQGQSTRGRPQPKPGRPNTGRPRRGQAGRPQASPTSRHTGPIPSGRSPCQASRKPAAASRCEAGRKPARASPCEAGRTASHASARKAGRIPAGAASCQAGGKTGLRTRHGGGTQDNCCERSGSSPPRKSAVQLADGGAQQGDAGHTDGGGKIGACRPLPRRRQNR